MTEVRIFNPTTLFEAYNNLAYGHPSSINFSSFTKADASAGTSSSASTPLTSSGQRVMLGKRTHAESGSSQQTPPSAQRIKVFSKSNPAIPIHPILAATPPSSAAEWVPASPLMRSGLSSRGEKEIEDIGEVIPSTVTGVSDTGESSSTIVEDSLQGVSRVVSGRGKGRRKG